MGDILCVPNMKILLVSFLQKELIPNRRNYMQSISNQSEGPFKGTVSQGLYFLFFHE